MAEVGVGEGIAAPPDPNSFEAIDRWSPRFSEGVRRDIRNTYDVVIQSLERMDIAERYIIKEGGKNTGRMGVTLTDKFYATPKDQLPFPQAKAEDFDIKFDNNSGRANPTLTLSWKHQAGYSATLVEPSNMYGGRSKLVKPAKIQEQITIAHEGDGGEPFYYRNVKYLDDQGRTISERTDVVTAGKVKFSPRVNNEERNPPKIWQFGAGGIFPSHHNELLNIQESCKKAAAQVRRSPFRWFRGQF